MYPTCWTIVLLKKKKKKIKFCDEVHISNFIGTIIDQQLVLLRSVLNIEIVCQIHLDNCAMGTCILNKPAHHPPHQIMSTCMHVGESPLRSLQFIIASHFMWWEMYDLKFLFLSSRIWIIEILSDSKSNSTSKIFAAT